MNSVLNLRYERKTKAKTHEAQENKMEDAWMRKEEEVKDNWNHYQDTNKAEVAESSSKPSSSTSAVQPRSAIHRYVTHKQNNHSVGYKALMKQLSSASFRIKGVMAGQKFNDLVPIPEASELATWASSRFDLSTGHVVSTESADIHKDGSKGKEAENHATRKFFANRIKNKHYAAVQNLEEKLAKTELKFSTMAPPAGATNKVVQGLNDNFNRGGGARRGSVPSSNDSASSKADKNKALEMNNKSDKDGLVSQVPILLGRRRQSVSKGITKKESSMTLTKKESAYHMQKRESQDSEDSDDDRFNSFVSEFNASVNTSPDAPSTASNYKNTEEEEGGRGRRNLLQIALSMAEEEKPITTKHQKKNHNKQKYPVYVINLRRRSQKATEMLLQIVNEQKSTLRGVDPEILELLEVDHRSNAGINPNPVIEATIRSIKNTNITSLSPRLQKKRFKLTHTDSNTEAFEVGSRDEEEKAKGTTDKVKVNDIHSKILSMSKDTAMDPGYQLLLRCDEFTMKQQTMLKSLKERIESIDYDRRKAFQRKYKSFTINANGGSDFKMNAASDISIMRLQAEKLKVEENINFLESTSWFDKLLYKAQEVNQPLSLPELRFLNVIRTILEEGFTLDEHLFKHILINSIPSEDHKSAPLQKLLMFVRDEVVGMGVIKYHDFLQENKLFVSNALAAEVKSLVKVKLNNDTSRFEAKAMSNTSAVSGLRATFIAAKWKKKANRDSVSSSMSGSFDEEEDARPLSPGPARIPIPPATSNASRNSVIGHKIEEMRSARMSLIPVKVTGVH
jgi:hypothetical protein